MLANLSGFDGSPESMRHWQLEYGAEIGRAVTNFRGPIVFVVVSRYHGGAFVVFSKQLNPSDGDRRGGGLLRLGDRRRTGGRDGLRARGAVADRQRPAGDRRSATRIAAADADEAAPPRAALARPSDLVRSEKLGEVADEFDAIHTIQRARRVGSVDAIIPAAELRPYVIDALERGLARA